MKRKICSFIIAGAAALISVNGVFAAVSTTAETGFAVRANGILQTAGKDTISVNGSQMVNINTIDNILRADKIDWNEFKKCVTIYKGENKMELFEGSGKVYFNNKEVEGPSVFLSEAGVAYVPLRFVCEQFGAKVDWNQSTKTVEIAFDNDSEYVLLNTDKPVSKDTVVYSYDDALKMAVDKSSDIKNLDDSVEYLDEQRKNLGRSLRQINDAYGIAQSIENAGDNMSMQQELGLRVNENISSAISTIRGIKSIDEQKSLVDVNKEIYADTIELTLKSYLMALKNYDLQQSLVEENIKLAEENLKNIELKYSLGMESEYNLSQAKLDLENYQTTLETLINERAKIEQQIKTMLGVEANKNIVVDYEIEFDKLDDVDLESYITVKKESDPTIRLLKSNIEIAAYNLRTGKTLSQESNDLNQNNYNSAVRKLKDTQDQMESNIRNQYTTIKNLEEQDKANQIAVKKAMDTYNSVSVSYAAGATTKYNVDLAKLAILKAEIDIETNKLKYDTAVFSFNHPYMIGGSGQQ